MSTAALVVVDRPLGDRFWSKVDKDGPIPKYCPDLGKCWVWTAYSRKGYGRYRYKNETRLAYRLAYLERNGDIDLNLELDHLCRNPICVNPGHLDPVAGVENIRRSRVG